MINDFDVVAFNALKAKIENQTGFSCYVFQPGDHQTWYGTSDKLALFKELAEPYIQTGTAVYCIDTKTTITWSAFKQAWY